MKTLFLDTPWAFGLLTVSGLVGAFGSFVFFAILRIITGAKSEPILSREFLYAGLLTGIFERFFFTAVIGLFGSNGIAQAAIAWIAIKGQVHYKMFSEGKVQSVDMSRAYLGMLGSISSMVFAIIGGYIWQSGLGYAAVQAWLAKAFGS